MSKTPYRPSHPVQIEPVRARQATTLAVAGWLVAMFGAAFAPTANALDAAAAEKLVNDNKCVKCHAVDRKKDGPAYRDVAAKYRPDPEAVAKITHHVTAGDMVKFPDGHEERHKKLKVSSPDETRNVVDWILSLQGGTKY